MSDDLSILQTSSGLAADVRGMIEQTRGQVARVVNAGMTLLYWRIGRRIQVEVLGNQRAEYGKEILATLSQELSWSHFVEFIKTGNLKMNNHEFNAICTMATKCGQDIDCSIDIDISLENKVLLHLDRYIEFHLSRRLSYRMFANL